MKHRVVAGALVLVTIALTGCGGSGGNSGGASSPSTQASGSGASGANQWAHSFCSYAQSWKQSLQQSAATFKNTSQLSTNSATAALNNAKSATILFRGQLSKLGPPPTPNGSKVEQELKMYGGQLRGDAQTLKGEFQTSAGTTSELKQKAQSIALTLRAMANELRVAYKSLTQQHADDEFARSLKTNPTCRAVFAGG